MVRYLLLAALLAVPYATSEAHAQSLKIRQIQRDQEANLQSRLAETNQACGAALTARFDWSSFSAEDYDGANSMHGFCGAALSAISRICADPLGKEAVQQQLDSLVCARGPHEVRLAERNLTYVIDWPATDVEEQVYEFLLENLK